MLMRAHPILTILAMLIVIRSAVAQHGPMLQQAANTWVKRSPLTNTPPSPMLGYEGSFGYDPANKLLIRWAGHNQGGGGEQNAETWTFEPASARWTLKEPNLAPPELDLRLAFDCPRQARQIRVVEALADLGRLSSHLAGAGGVFLR
jgi:hypothetical protein